MIMWMEITCREAVLPHLEAGQDTVGTKVNVEHLSATPVGDRVTYKAVVKEMDGRRLTFEVEARDDREVVGRGTHERFIIDVERFARGLKKKFGQA
jgi:predicted thioesterase